MTELYLPPIVAPKLGDGEPHGGYYEWCVEREKWAPIKYTLRNHECLLFSIIVPVHNPEDHWLQQCIDSVRGQFFADWELILSDDASDPSTLAILKENQLIDERITVLFTEQHSGISATTNRAAELAKGHFLVFLDHDDMLDAYALSAFAQHLQKKPTSDLLYADEDRFDENYHRLHPGFKPQFSLEKLLCTNYIHHPVVIRSILFTKIGGLDSQFDGSQDYDFLLRVVEKTIKIEHVPDVLYHMRIHQRSLSSGAEAKPEAHGKGRAAVQAYLDRQKIVATVVPTLFDGYHTISYPLSSHHKVTILLLGHPELSIETILINWQQNKDVEVLICEQYHLSIPKRLNQLAKEAQGDILIIADAQLRPEPDCVEILSAHCVRKGIGLVTGKLIYNNGLLHSSGLVCGIKGSGGLWHYSCNADDLGYGAWMGINHEVSAVPWQLMAIKKELLIKADFFNTDYIFHGFDIHLALQLSEFKKINHLAISSAKAVFIFPCPLKPEVWTIEDFMCLRMSWQKKLNQDDPYYHPYFSVYDESISLMNKTELRLKKLGLFETYDRLTIQLLWQCFNKKENSINE